MYQTVLTPIDGSDAAFDAARHALDLVADEGTIHVLYVIESKPSYTRFGLSGLQDETVLDEHQEFAEERVERIADIAEERGIECTTAVKTGTPYTQIVEYAEGIDADVIVMGKHGYDWGGIEEKVLGSTTERVLKRASMPVLTVQ